MTFSKVLALVEGDTEYGFLQRVIVPHLTSLGVFLTPITITTKRIIGGSNRKGGLTKYAPVRKELLGLLGDTSAVMVTTMFDYYALPEDFPGQSDLPPGNCYTRVLHVERALRLILPNSMAVIDFSHFLRYMNSKGYSFPLPKPSLRLFLPI